MQNDTTIPQGNKRSLEFNVGDYCQFISNPVICDVITLSDGSLMIGPYRKGNFTARPDLAGPGVLWAFFIPSLIGVFMLFLAAFFIWCESKGTIWERIKVLLIPAFFQPDRKGWRNHVPAIFEQVLLSASDSQSFLAIAYWVSFYLEGKCTLSAYHYSLALDFGLVSFSTFVASTAIVHGYPRAPLATLLRYIAALVPFGIISTLIVYQHGQSDAPEQWPSKDKSTSALFLPISCFLDPLFNGTIFPNATNPDQTVIIDQIGPPDNAKFNWEFPLWIVNLILLVVGFLKNIYLLRKICQNRSVGDQKVCSKWYIRLIMLYRFISILVYIGTCSIAGAHIMWIREFVHNSHWLALDRDGTSGESNLSQLLPLIALTGIPIALFKLWEPKKNPDSDNYFADYDRNSYQRVSSNSNSQSPFPLTPSPHHQSSHSYPRAAFGRAEYNR